MLSSLILSWAALSPLLLAVQAQDVVTDDTFFYGQSEPVYPTPETSELGAWADAVGKAKEFVGQLTLEEKVWHTVPKYTYLSSAFNTSLSGEPHCWCYVPDWLLRLHPEYYQA